MIILFVTLIVSAYLFSSLPAAQIMAKVVKGVDLKQFGSGNVGASNLVRATSRRTAIPVIIFDFVKGLLAVLLAKWLGMDAYQQVVVGLAAIAGHNWPVFLGFSGGRGILTSLGVVAAFLPWAAVITLAIAALFTLFRQVALGVLVAAAALPLEGWLFGNATRLPYAMCLLAILAIVIFRRLTASTPPLAKPPPLRELLVNRLLFDRDIADRQAWDNRLSSEHPSPAVRKGDRRP